MKWRVQVSLCHTCSNCGPLTKQAHSLFYTNRNILLERKGHERRAKVVTDQLLMATLNHEWAYDAHYGGPYSGVEDMKPNFRRQTENPIRLFLQSKLNCLLLPQWNPTGRDVLNECSISHFNILFVRVFFILRRWEHRAIWDQSWPKLIVKHLFLWVPCSLNTFLDSN